jgi:hypothetical protein
MFRFAFLAALSLAALAQTSAPPAEEKPPADVDQALRARANEFYTLVKNHEYRKAEALIAEDTKDYYYEGSKQEISGFVVQNIEYSDHFTHAKVWTQCGQAIAAPGFPAGEFTLRIPTTWRLENGVWMLYVDQTKVMSPLGYLMPSPSGTKPAPAGEPPKSAPPNPNLVMGKLSTDKQAVQLSAGGTDQVRITNGSPGTVSLELGYPLRGIETKLDRTDLGIGQTAILTFKAVEQPTAGTYYLRVMPMQQVLGIEIQVK